MLEMLEALRAFVQKREWMEGWMAGWLAGENELELCERRACVVEPGASKWQEHRTDCCGSVVCEPLGDKNAKIEFSRKVRISLDHFSHLTLASFDAILLPSSSRSHNRVV